MLFYYRKKEKIHFEPHPDLVAVSIKGKQPEKDEKKFLSAVAEAKLDLKPEKLSKILRQTNVRVLKMSERSGEAEQKRMYDGLKKIEIVGHTGPVVHFDDKGISFLTNKFIVKYKNAMSRNELMKIIKPYKLKIARQLPYISNTYVLQTENQVSYKFLDIVNEFAMNDQVEYAEPNMVTTDIDDFTPGDFLFASQAHHQIINTEAAWDVIMGDHDIIIAVVDSGCDYDHPEFTNDPALGWDKVYKKFDFSTMTEDPTSGSHGTKSCGIATANSDNNEGVVGVAPGCRLMALKYPGGLADENYADMYMWIAGFDPGSTLFHFPDPINPGADVISNSFGRYETVIPSVMADTFDYITQHGRNGKGCVVVFSVGNGTTDFTTYRQWAAYDKTIAVASSTISPPDAAEVRVSSSNWGSLVDLCAPGGGPSGGAETRALSTTNVGTGDTAGTAGGTNLDYDDFGQTSCACPQVAGAAALMLSIRPDLRWYEVRDILRDTAVQIDLSNTDPVGQWVSGFSQWYGYGRLDVAAAVVAARDYVRPIDPGRLPGKPSWLVEGFIIDRRTWIMYLIIDRLSVDWMKYAQIPPDKKFYMIISGIVDEYMNKGVSPPAEIATAIMNVADDIMAGRDVVFKAGDYVTLQSYVRNQEMMEAGHGI